jgi:hypothetical protein
VKLLLLFLNPSDVTFHLHRHPSSDSELEKDIDRWFNANATKFPSVFRDGCKPVATHQRFTTWREAGVNIVLTKAIG